MRGAVINDSTGEIVTVGAQQDGSFTGRIMAMLGDKIKIMILDAAGNQTLVSYITFKSDDGRYFVTSRGGVVEGEGGTRLEIPEGALVTPTVVKITPLAEDQLPHPAPQGAQYLAAVNIDTGGVKFQKEIHLSVPAPSGVKTEDLPFVARPQDLTNPDGTVEKVYVIVDSAKVVDGRLSTASPPFDGVVDFGPFVFTFPTMYPTVVAGYAYWDKDGVAGYSPHYDPATGNLLPDSDRPIKGAIIRSFGGFQYIVYSNDKGHYATFGLTDWEMTGDCRTLKMTAINPMTMFRQNIDVALCNKDWPKINFRLGEASTEIPDTTAPSITLNVQVVPGQVIEGTSTPPQFVAGTIPTNTDLSLVLESSDQQIASTSLTVSYKTPDAAAQECYVPLSQGAPVQTGTYQTDPTDPNTVKQIFKTAYVPNFGSLSGGTCAFTTMAGSAAAYFKPTNPGTYTLKVTAIDTAGHESTKSLTMRAVLGGSQLEGIDGKPTVDEIVPSDGAKNVMVTMPVTVTFSEPINTDSANGKITLSAAGATVLTDVYYSSEGGRMRAVLVPKNNLMFGTEYRVVVSPGIRDELVNASTGSTYLYSDQTYTAAFRTKDPEVYEVDQPFKNGKDIALYTHPNTGQTYAYITADTEGWYAVNVTDPTNPVFTYKENWNAGGGLLFKYRGVAVDQEKGILGITEWIQGSSELGIQFGYVRFYSLLENPQKPVPIIGQERIAEAYSGVPDRVVISGNHAYVNTLMVGLQVIDIDIATAPHKTGESLVGLLPTVDLEQCPQPGGGSKCGNPSDLALYKGNRLLIPTFTGYLLTVDVTEPTMPAVMSAYKPDNFGAWRVAVAEAYPYVEAGETKVMDLAVVSSGLAQSRIYTVDVTDPLHPNASACSRTERSRSPGRCD